MIKYKIVGILGTFAGAVVSAFSLYYMIFVVPQLAKMYSQLNVDLSNTLNPYVVLSTLLIIGLAYTFIGLSLLIIKKSERLELYFKIGVAMLLLIFIALPILMGFFVYSSMLPVYKIYDTVSGV